MKLCAFVSVCFINLDQAKSQEVGSPKITYIDSASLYYRSYPTIDSTNFSGFAWRNYFLEQVEVETAETAKEIIEKTPFSVTLQSMPRDMVELPVAEKKELFFSVMERISKFHNQVISLKRERLMNISHSKNDYEFLEKMVVEYSLERASERMLSRADTLRVLLTRVDCIPPSLILAQSAIESGWGTSRFAREGNNLFGQRVWSDKIPGMKASGRSEAKFRLAVYPDISESVKSYLRNLNTHPFYQSLRDIRERKRVQKESISGLDLVSEIGSYSIRGKAYIFDVKRMIEFNNLTNIDENTCI